MKLVYSGWMVQKVAVLHFSPAVTVYIRYWQCTMEFSDLLKGVAAVLACCKELCEWSLLFIHSLNLPQPTHHLIHVINYHDAISLWIVFIVAQEAILIKYKCCILLGQQRVAHSLPGLHHILGVLIFSTMWLTLNKQTCRAKNNSLNLAGPLSHQIKFCPAVVHIWLAITICCQIKYCVVLTSELLSLHTLLIRVLPKKGRELNLASTHSSVLELALECYHQ